MKWVYVFRQNGTQCILLDKMELDVKKLYKVGINPNFTTRNPLVLKCNDDCEGM